MTLETDFHGKGDVPITYPARASSRLVDREARAKGPGAPAASAASSERGDEGFVIELLFGFADSSREDTYSARLRSFGFP